MDERKKTIEALEVAKRLRREAGTAPDQLVEILYEYLSEHISTHFEKTIEGLDTLHNALRQRQEEHAEIMKLLDELVERVKALEEQVGRAEDKAR